MAKKKSKKPEKKEKKVVREPSAIELQIWGVTYMSLAILMLISLISHYGGDGASNILGPWLGTYFTLGLEGLFGSVAIFLLPAMVFYVGFRIFRGESFNIFTLIITVMVIVEMSVLMAIPHLSIMVNNTPQALFEEIDGIGNAVGMAIMYWPVSKIFGENPFGPYFIVTISFILTIVGFLEINLRDVFLKIKEYFQNYMASAKIRAEEAKVERKERSDAREQVRQERKTLKQEAIKERRSKEKAKGPSIEDLAKKMADSDESIVVAPPEVDENPFLSIPPVINPVEEAVASVMPIDPVAVESEEPFVLPEIVTYEGDQTVDSEAEPTLDSDGDIGDAAFLEPSLAKGEVACDDEHLSTGSAELVEELPKQKPYKLPDVNLIPEPPARNHDVDKIWIEEKSITLIRTLEEFRLKGCQVVAAHSGPVVTQFEINLAPGIQVKKILSLQDDIALKVGGKAIRIQAPIPGKPAVGIEIPNDAREIVYYKDILTSATFKNSKAKLPVIVGKSISGKPLIEDISKMPHILIAGQTGAGKSVGINAFIATLLFSRTPEELRLIMIDPKKVEMACYEGIPHLLSPVVTEPEKAVAALQWGVKEMEYRYRLLAKVGAKNLDSFNAKVDSGALKKFLDRGDIEEEETRKLPYIVIIIDELADLMMTASKDVEALVQRIAQLARAVGIHLIVATQRPSVDIITGPIKANLTSRISYRTIQSQDSRTILGAVGAEKLLGMGDMLYLKNGAPAIERYHGAFISEEDVERLVEDIKDQSYETGKIFFKAAEKTEKKNDIPKGAEDHDELFEEVARLIMTNGIASTSMVQRRFKIGYNRAGRIMDQLEDSGVVGPSQGGKPREILITKDVLEEILDLME